MQYRMGNEKAPSHKHKGGRLLSSFGWSNVQHMAEQNENPLHPLGHRGYIVWCAVQDSNL